jgi:hypothetical protein
MTDDQEREICDRYMQRAWAEWHTDVEDDLLPAINISFRKGFYAAWCLAISVREDGSVKWSSGRNERNQKGDEKSVGRLA